jgi:DNA replication protein DnaC
MLQSVAIPPGVGKTHLALALGHLAVDAGYRVCYVTAADLVARCHRAALEGRWATTMRTLAGHKLLIIDELGYICPCRPKAPPPCSRSSPNAT